MGVGLSLLDLENDYICILVLRKEYCNIFKGVLTNCIRTLISFPLGEWLTEGLFCLSPMASLPEITVSLCSTCNYIGLCVTGGQDKATDKPLLQCLPQRTEVLVRPDPQPLLIGCKLW